MRLCPWAFLQIDSSCLVTSRAGRIRVRDGALREPRARVIAASVACGIADSGVCVGRQLDPTQPISATQLRRESIGPTGAAVTVISLPIDRFEKSGLVPAIQTGPAGIDLSAFGIDRHRATNEIRRKCRHIFRQCRRSLAFIANAD